MEGLAHSIQSLIRKHNHCLRSLKTLSTLQLPVKILRIDSHCDTGRIMSIHFRLHPVISTVNQTESQNLPCILRCRRTSQNHKRIMLMRRISPDTSHRLHSLLQLSFLHMTLPRPCTGKLHPHILLIREIQTETHRTQQMYTLLTLIRQLRTSRHNTTLCKNRIQKFQNHSRHFILQLHT